MKTVQIADDTYAAVAELQKKEYSNLSVDQVVEFCATVGGATLLLNPDNPAGIVEAARIIAETKMRAKRFRNPPPTDDQEQFTE